MRRRASRQEGMALIMAVLVLSILMALVIQFTYSAAVAVQVSANAEEGWKNRYVTRGGVAVVGAYLAHSATATPKSYCLGKTSFETFVKNPSANGKVLFARVDRLELPASPDAPAAPASPDPNAKDSGDHALRIEAQDTALVMKVFDEERRFNLNVLHDPKVGEQGLKVLAQLLALPELDLGLQADAAANLAKAIQAHEKIGPPEQPGQPGQPGGKPVPPPKPAPAPGGPADPNAAPVEALQLGRLVSLRELLDLKDVPYELLFGKPDRDPKDPILAEYLGCWSNGRINLNTAPPLVIKAVFGALAAGKQLQTPDLAQLVKLIQDKRDGDKPFEARDKESFFQELKDTGIAQEWVGKLEPDPTPAGQTPAYVPDPLLELLCANADTFSAYITRGEGNVREEVHAVIQRNATSTDLLLWEEVRPLPPPPTQVKAK